MSMVECGVGDSGMQEPLWRVGRSHVGRTADVWESAMVAIALLWASHAVALMRSVVAELVSFGGVGDLDRGYRYAKVVYQVLVLTTMDCYSRYNIGHVVGIQLAAVP
jgi:hypothetical protein